MIFPFFYSGYIDNTRRKIVADSVFEQGWSIDKTANRLIEVWPSEKQHTFLENNYFCIIHYGMNTFLGKNISDGSAAAERFCPTDTDTDQWCKAVLDSGANALIFAPKHFDGFCLWQTRSTDYSVKKSPYLGGDSDILKQVADSCKKFKLKLGIYFPLWDRHEKSFGTVDGYNNFVITQITELMKNYGEIFMVWLDDYTNHKLEHRIFTYDLSSMCKQINLIQPNCLVAKVGSDVRWIGNNRGKVRKNEWSVISANYNPKSEDLGSREVLSSEKKLIFSPSVAPVSLRYGLFFKKLQLVRSLASIRNLYYSIAGRNSTMLLNISPTTDGIVLQKDVELLKEFGKTTLTDLKKPIHISVTTSKGTDCTALLTTGNKVIRLLKTAFILILL
jgi:alpha-L-fucosidase